MTAIASSPSPVPFVDPRTSPSPVDPRPPARLATAPADLVEFLELCRSGRLYDVERWIQAGRSLQLAAGTPERRRQDTALEIALERQDQALTLLLLANGYDLTLEPRNPLDTALSMRRQDLLDLFLAWGANPRAVCVDTLLATYDSRLFEHFSGLGTRATSRSSVSSSGIEPRRRRAGRRGPT